MFGSHNVKKVRKWNVECQSKPNEIKFTKRARKKENNKFKCCAYNFNAEN